MAKEYRQNSEGNSDSPERPKLNPDEKIYSSFVSQAWILGKYMDVFELGFGDNPNLVKQFEDIEQGTEELEKKGNIRKEFTDAFGKNYGPLVRKMRKYKKPIQSTEHKPKLRKRIWKYLITDPNKEK